MSKARGLADLGNAFDDGALSNRNLIINGAMQVAQRGTSSTNDTAGTYYTVDRFKAASSVNLGSFDTEQSSDFPNGFSSSLKFSVNTAGSGTTNTEQTFVEHLIEGQNLQHLAYGTSNAQKLTLSFWAKSSETGNKVLWFYQPSAARHYAQTFALSQANTWEKFTILIPADTSGVISNNNGRGFYVRFVLDAGTGYTGGIPDGGWVSLSNGRYGGVANFMQDASNEFYITGVQLEVGDTATPFEHRSYGDELARCQRYYYRLYKTQAYQNLGNASMFDANNVYVTYQWPVVMRANPTVSLSSASDFNVTGNGSDLGATGYSVGHASPFNVQINLNRSGLTNGYAYWVRMAGGGTDVSKFLQADAEL